MSFLFSSWIIETEGEEAVFHLSSSSLFLEKKKERQHVHLKLVTDDLILHFRQAGSTCVAGWGTTPAFSGHGVVSQNLVILSHSLFALVLLC